MPVDLNVVKSERKAERSIYPTQVSSLFSALQL